jgi:predicted nucleic acid-binding protein
MLARGMRGVTSTTTLAEVLVQPLRRGNVALANLYQRLLLHSDYLDIVPVTGSVAVRAATLRADYGLKLPDALHLAVAQEAGCEAFLTNDRALSRVKEPRIILLDELEI